MPKRRSMLKEPRIHGHKPKLSRYGKKRAARRLESRLETPAVPAVPTTSSENPNHVEAKVVANKLHRGYVFLSNIKTSERIFLSEQTLADFDPMLCVSEGLVLTCTVSPHEKGLRADRVLSVQVPT